MLQQEGSEDFVIATETTFTLEDFVKATFEQSDLNWQQHMIQDPTLLLPTDLAVASADCNKAKQAIDWTASNKGIDVVKKSIKLQINIST